MVWIWLSNMLEERSNQFTMGLYFALLWNHTTSRACNGLIKDVLAGFLLRRFKIQLRISTFSPLSCLTRHGDQNCISLGPWGHYIHLWIVHIDCVPEEDWFSPASGFRNAEGNGSTDLSSSALSGWFRVWVRFRFQNPKKNGFRQVELKNSVFVRFHPPFPAEQLSLKNTTVIQHC